ncbi:hypothetical protein EJB05_01378, partial [Eragrostis curvula]
MSPNVRHRRSSTTSPFRPFPRASDRRGEASTFPTSIPRLFPAPRATGACSGKRDAAFRRLPRPEHTRQQSQDQLPYAQIYLNKDMMMDVPALPNVISLTIKIDSVFGHGHTIGATLAKLIAKCARIEYLSIDIRVMPEECSDPSCICDHPKGWDRQKMWLQHLRNVEIHDNCLLDSHMRLVQLLLANAPALDYLRGWQ